MGKDNIVRDANRSHGKNNKNGKKREPNRPKGAVSASLYYANENRKTVKEDNPSMSQKEVVSFIGILVCTLLNYFYTNTL